MQQSPIIKKNSCKTPATSPFAVTRWAFAFQQQHGLFIPRMDCAVQRCISAQNCN